MNTKTTLVCVTGQTTCERLIRAGSRVSSLTATGLSVISVPRENPTNDDLRNLEFLYEKSKEFGADMHIVYNNDAYNTLAKFIKQNNVANVITGMPVGESSVLEKLWERFPNVSFYAVDFSDVVLEVRGGRLQMINKNKVNI